LTQHGQKTVTVSGELLRKLDKEYQIEKVKRPSLSFAGFISESAVLELERRNILREAQLISLIGFQDNVITLKDMRKKNRFIEVHLRNEKLWCDYDQTPDCIHVGFALALPEVRKRLNV